MKKPLVVTAALLCFLGSGSAALAAPPPEGESSLQKLDARAKTAMDEALASANAAVAAADAAVRRAEAAVKAVSSSAAEASRLAA
ncbi:MAG TPA: hypothetical protein VM471_03805, partial [Phenylobacterium sp.]|nr:hypothetical protein [Phenylobacterium sp.]